MDLKHKVTINVGTPGEEKSPVLTSKKVTLRGKVMEFLFGEKVGILVITPGDTVETVEIKEV